MRITVFAAVLLSLALCATAATVNVQPSNMNGWVEAVQNGGVISWSDGSDPTKPNYPTPAVRMYNSGTGGKAVVGTDAYAGALISQISSWTMRVMWDTRQAPYGQPPSIELVTWTGQMRIFEFFPWGKTQYPAGSEPWAQHTWNVVDLLSPTGYWELANTGSTNCFGNWDWVVARYADQTIWSPTLYGAEVPPQQVINAVGLSVKIGPSLQISSNPMPGNTNNNQKNLNGFVDWMDITVAGEQTLYDFGVPEPGTLAALATGLIGFFGLRKRF